MCPNDLVAFARGGFQLFPLQYADSSVPARDQSCALERAQHDRHGGTVHAQHHRQEFLLQGKIVAIDSIMCLQQPATTPLPDVVEGVARGALQDLQEVSPARTRR
jgi:hypothetical protein